MPETAHKEYYKSVPNYFCLANAAAAQRDIQIVAKPCGERNVPPTPKLRYVTAEVRHVEVAHQLDAKQLGSTYGNVGISREVAVYLEGKEYGGKKQSASRLFRVGRKYLVDIYRTIVSHHYLLEQAPQYLTHSVNGGVVVELTLFLKLREKVCRSLYRSGYQLWEKRNEGEESDNVLRRLQLATIDIYGVTQGLESIKRNANWQYYLEQKSIGGDIEKFGEFGYEKIVVLEHGKNSDIQHYVGPHPGLGLFLSIRLPYQKTAAPRTERGEGYEQQKTPVPPAVEHIARQHHKGVLQPQLMFRLAYKTVEDKPVKQKNYWKK
jgi:hypothetical protein